jgi:hypothetical protein
VLRKERKEYHMRLKILATTLACAAVSLTAAVAAKGGATETWNLYDCSGPAGTPASFSATRTATSVGNSLHVDGGGTFVVLYAYNADLGVYNVPVVSPGKLQTAAVQCSAIGPKFGAQFTLWGLFAP